jgi:hypothetical protein
VEYITQLEETVEEYENTIKGLKDENAKLRKSNQDLMKQVLSQPITPPTSSGDELLSSSGSEGHQSPEPVPSLFQFQLNDIYDFNLFDQQTLNQPDQPMQINDSANMFFLNHATMPDWDIHQVLGEKGRPVTSEEHQSQLSKELISNYPLLAPALMSIVLRHTLSLEYVTSLAKELEGTLSTDHVKSSTIDDDQETLRGVDMEDLKASFNSLKIEDIKKKEEEEEEEEEEEKENDDDEKLTEEEKAERKANKLKDEELVDMMLNDYFAYYAVMRARGFTHQQLVDRCRECLKQKYLKKSLRENKKQAKQKAAESKSSKWSTNAQTLQTYCRVAGSLLRHPQRMAHVRQVLKKEIVFTQNKHTVHIENNYRKLVNGNYKNQCITNTTTTC